MLLILNKANYLFLLRIGCVMVIESGDVITDFDIIMIIRQL